MAQDIVSRVASRYKQGDADQHNPDPLTYKAFLTEYQQGVKRGEQMSHETVLEDSPVPTMNELVVVEEKIRDATVDLLDIARRLETLATRGSLGVNEHRLAAKMSGILSTLFYQTGVAKGLKG